MIIRIKHIISVLFLLGLYSMSFAAPPEVARFTLSNGIRVVNMYVEDSKDVGIFSYLPLGLVSDGKAKTQWSHLIEHLTIRTTGPIDYKTSNAETMADNMRLDFMGTTDTLRQGLDLQAKWLSGLPFSKESLDEELPRAISELDVVEKRLATHKFAQAAWNQVFRHGVTDIAMRGDIQSAKLSELQTYRDLHLVQADRVMLCVIGGVELNRLKTEMEETLGTINLTAKTFPQVTTSTSIPINQNATWDVSVTHYMETYRIPQVTHEKYPALYLMSLLLNQSLMNTPDLKHLTGSIYCGVDLVTPEQTYLYITASVKPDSDIEKIKLRISHLINQLKQTERNTQVPFYAQSLSRELSGPPDIALLKQYKPANISETLMVLQIGVSWGMMEYRYGNTLEKLASDFSKVTAADVADVVNEYLTEDKRMTLLLTPRVTK